MHSDESPAAPETAVLHVGGLHYATEKLAVEDVLGRRPGVVAVEANPAAFRFLRFSPLYAHPGRCAKKSLP